MSRSVDSHQCSSLPRRARALATLAMLGTAASLVGVAVGPALVSADDGDLIPVVSTARREYAFGETVTVGISGCGEDGQTVWGVIFQNRGGGTMVLNRATTCSGGTASVGLPLETTNVTPGTYYVTAKIGSSFVCCGFTSDYAITVTGAPTPPTDPPPTPTTQPPTPTTQPPTTQPPTPTTQPPTPSGPAIVTSDGNDIEVAGRPTTFTGTGFEPGESVTGTFHSNPIAMGTQVADAGGRVVFSFTVPRDIVLGVHRVVMVGDQSGTVELPVTVAANTSTGRPAGPGQQPAASQPPAAVLPVTR